MIRFYIKWLKYRSLIFLDTIFLALSKKSMTNSGVVIVRLDRIGDFILWLDSAKEYRRIYSNQKITLIANSSWADLAKVMPYWDEVWAVDLINLVRNPIYRYSLFKRLLNAGFEIAIQPTISRVILHGDSLIRASKANNRIGSSGDVSNSSLRENLLSDGWYSRLLPININAPTELEGNLNFIKKLSGLEFQLSLPHIPASKLLLSNMNVPLPEDYFVVCPGGSWDGKCWPASKFARMVKQVHSKYGWTPVLCGSIDDFKLSELIICEAGCGCINLAGCTSLIGLIEVIRGAHMTIGNDSSAVHIAAGVGNPAVCILGGGHFGRFFPYPKTINGVKPLVAYRLMDCFNCGWMCTQNYEGEGPVPCVKQITVEAVMNRIKEAIEG